MSGNPFRKSAPVLQPTLDPQQQEESDPPPTSAFNFGHSNLAAPANDVSSDRRESKGKRVRIETPPPLSPDLPFEEEPIIRRVSNEAHEGSPPPSPDSPPDRPLFTSPFDPYDPLNLSGTDENLFPSHQVVENTRRNSETNNARRSSTGGVVNPFQRTLATLEHTEGLEESQPAVETEVNDTENIAKPQMDVDSFKRMLLTGNAAPAPLSPSPTNGQEIPPRPSASALSSGQINPDGQRSPTSEVEKKRSIPPPPPPASRHGKLVEQSRIPQTVSFDDFAPTETSGSTIPRNTSTISSTLTSDSKLPNSATSQSTTASLVDSQKKTPPAPPQARRPLARESSSSSVPQQETGQYQPPLASPPLPSSATRTTMNKAPPPPPSRRSGPKPLTPSETSVSQPAVSSPQEETAPGVSSRSSSRSSRTRASAPAPPPPPPPVRRRSSNKSSTENVAVVREALSDVNTNSQEISVNPSSNMTTADNHQTSAVGVTGNVDVLADMDRLQAEVDALRARYGNN